MTYDMLDSSIYLACKLTNLSAEYSQTITGDCTAISAAVVTASQEDSPPWGCTVYSPAIHTAPWLNLGLTADQIWYRNTRQVLCLSDGLIAHGHSGGSNGVGHEITMAYGRGIPILYVHHESVPVSLQIQGMRRHAAWFSIEPFQNRDHLTEIAGRWVKKNRLILNDGPSYRKDVAVSWQKLTTELSHKWDLLLDSADDGDRLAGEAAFIARMSPEEISDTVSDPLLVASLPGSKLLQLGAALGVHVAAHLGYIRRLPDLLPIELENLEEWRAAKGYGRSFATTLSHLAQQLRVC